MIIQTPEGLHVLTPGFNPGDIKKHNVGFGGIFAFFAKIVTKHNKQNINKIQNYKHMKQLFTIIFFAIALFARAQYQPVQTDDGKAEFFSQPKGIPGLNPDYYWQNDHLWDYDVHFYFVDIEVTPASVFVSGNCTIGATAVTQIDTFAFELIPEQNIDSIFVNNTRYTQYTREVDNVLVPVSAIANGTDFTAQIYYHGQPPSGGFFSGVTHDHSYTYNKDVTWTLSEPFAAKDWFPVKQDLEDKADSAWIFLTCDTAYMAGSEGVLTNVTDLGNGKHRFEWKEHHAIDYYLISFSVSDYQDYSIYAHPSGLNGDSVLIQNYIYDDPSCLQVNKAGIDATADILELYSDLYITYPFSDEKYGHCLTELGGGMEHQTMTTIGGFSFHLVSHELGHMWFGDNVTCATWSDIWINEGFATYSNYLAEEKLHGWASGQSFIVSTQANAMSNTWGSIYVPEDQIYQGNEWRIFNGQLSYDKGASIIHMIRHEVGDDSVFFNVMGTFQTQYTDSTATGDDFKNVLEDVTGTDWDYFFDQWYYGYGFPHYSLDWYYTGGKFHLVSTQTPANSNTPFFKMLMDYKLIFDDGTDTLIQLWQNANLEEYEIPLEKTVVDIEVDPDNWTLEQVDSIVGTVEETGNPLYFTLGPNPARQQVTLFFSHSIKGENNITITDLQGRSLLNFNTNRNKVTVNLSDLPKGLYFVKVVSGNKHFRRRLVKL